MRLQVFLSRSGACSRRKALEYIKSARVTVNGRRALEPSLPVDISGDIVNLDGKRISPKGHVYILLNKPKGVVTTLSDKFAPRKVIDLLPGNLRHLYPAGRLDKDTSGLLLLTNDGYLAHRLTHPSFEVQKVYRVFLDRRLSEEDKKKLQNGVMLEARRTYPCRIRKISGLEHEIIIHEGRKRQIRKMFALMDYEVRELSRIKQGPLTLGRLAEGQWRFLKEEEIEKLHRELGL